MSCGSRGRDPCLLFQGQINVAKRRVVMASLYLGTGPLEQELVRFEVPGGWGRAGGLGSSRVPAMAGGPRQEGHGRRAAVGLLARPARHARGSEAAARCPCSCGPWVKNGFCIFK